MVYLEIAGSLYDVRSILVWEQTAGNKESFLHCTGKCMRGNLVFISHYSTRAEQFRRHLLLKREFPIYEAHR